MIVITEAAPGLVPHSAVVPGSTCQRVISQPIVLEITTTATTPTVKSTQWLSTSPTIDSGTILAIRQPTMPCATTKGVQRQPHLAAARGEHDRRRAAAPASAPPAHAARQQCRKAADSDEDAHCRAAPPSLRAVGTALPRQSAIIPTATSSTLS